MKNKKIKSSDIRVVYAKYLGLLCLEIEFSDGKKVRNDFFNFIQNHPNPMIKKYSDESLFKSFHLNMGNVEWGDLDMIFPIEFLYNFNQLTTV